MLDIDESATATTLNASEGGQTWCWYVWAATGSSGFQLDGVYRMDPIGYMEGIWLLWNTQERKEQLYSFLSLRGLVGPPITMMNNCTDEDRQIANFLWKSNVLASCEGNAILVFARPNINFHDLLASPENFGEDLVVLMQDNGGLPVLRSKRKLWVKCITGAVIAVLHCCLLFVKLLSYGAAELRCCCAEMLLCWG
ncbi:unnamed protein product [Ilex paraguariensis]|uniref:Uncharacterized protein n=1 Tax=Ilex paraguariensis TaxID=185542 RepID=A0ABC8SSY6_9AQUA